MSFQKSGAQVSSLRSTHLRTLDGHPYHFQYAFFILSMGVLFPKGILTRVGLARFLPLFVCKIFSETLGLAYVPFSLTKHPTR